MDFLDSCRSSPVEIQDDESASGGDVQPVITCVFSQGAASMLHAEDSVKKTNSKSLLKPKNPPEKLEEIVDCVMLNYTPLLPKPSQIQTNVPSDINKKKRLNSPHIKRNVPGCKRKSPQKETILYCDLCDNRPFLSQRALVTHVQIRHFEKRPFHCKICNRSLKTQASLTLHMREIHGPLKEPSTICPLCKKSFSEEKVYLRHKKSCCPYECKICCIYFKGKSKYLEHQRIGRHGIQLLE